MCIACELGYWSMVDALEAERNASRQKAVPTAEALFVCEPDAERPQGDHPPQSADESTP